MLPSSWKPAPANGLDRLGSPHDGGYVVSLAAAQRSTLLISMGLNDDWRFEKDFRARTRARIICLDHSVTAHFWAWHMLHGIVRLSPPRATRFFGYRRFFALPNVEHRLLKVGFDGNGEVSLDSLFKEVSDDSIFLKIDIEGSEYRILDSILAHASRLTGIAIEFHDIDLHRERITAFLSSMREFKIIDLHANNFGGTDGNGDPLVIELSLARSDLLGDIGQGANCFSKASPNNPELPEIDLVFGDA